MSQKLTHILTLMAFLAVLHKSAGATTAINKDEMQERLCALDAKYCKTEETAVKTETEDETEAIAANGADDDNQKKDDKNSAEVAEREDDDDTGENALEESVDASEQGRRVRLRRTGRRGSKGKKNRRRRGNRKGRRNGKRRISRRRKANRG